MLVFLLTMAGPVQAQIFTGSGGTGGPGAQPPYLFVPRFDDDWEETATDLAAALPFTDPIFPTSPRQSAERVDDRVELKIRLADHEEQTWSLRIREKIRSFHGVDPHGLPQALMFEYARHRNGMSVVPGQAATVTAFGPPGTFASLGTGEDAVRAAAIALGVPLENGPGHETDTEPFDHAYWKDGIDNNRAPQGTTMFETRVGQLIPYCECTKVTIRSPLLGDTLNRVVGLLDEDDTLILIHTTPWIDLARLDLIPVERAEEDLARYINETTGHPLDSIQSEFLEYDLLLSQGNPLTLAAFFKIVARPETDTGISWSDAALHPEDGTVLRTGHRLVETAAAMPVLLPVLLAFTAAGGLLRNRHR